MGPKRIRLSRAKGWRMPDGAVKVDRSTKWGNPFVVGVDGTRAECVDLYAKLSAGYICLSAGPTVDEQRAARDSMKKAREELRGRDLACWCQLDAPCHADILLKIANR